MVDVTQQYLIFLRYITHQVLAAHLVGCGELASDFTISKSD